MRKKQKKFCFFLGTIDDLLNKSFCWPKGVEENEEYERDLQIEQIGDEGRGYRKLYNGKFPLEDPYYEEYEVCQKAVRSGSKFSHVEKGQLLERLSVGEVFALTDSLVYNYDYGDGNVVIITAKKD